MTNTNTNTNRPRFLRPTPTGYDVYIGGDEPMYRIGSIIRESEESWRARFRDCDPGDLGTFITPVAAALAMDEAYREEGKIIREQIAYERANGWSTE